MSNFLKLENSGCVDFQCMEKKKLVFDEHHSELKKKANLKTFKCSLTSFHLRYKSVFRKGKFVHFVSWSICFYFYFSTSVPYYQRVNQHFHSAYLPFFTYWSHAKIGQNFHAEYLALTHFNENLYNFFLWNTKVDVVQNL